MAKKKLDKLSLDMIQCKKDGYGVHYGRWKATQEPVKPEESPLPDGWLICAHCGKRFKPKTGRPTKYCEAYCANAAFKVRKRERDNQRQREWREKQERNVENENESYA